MDNNSLKQKTKRGIYWKFFDTFANTGMQFIVGIVMARLLSPEDYGITALPAVFFTIASIFIDGSFANALIRKKEVTEKDLSTAFYYSFGMGIFMYVCLFFASPYIARFYNTPILTSLIRVTALNFLWGPLLTPQTVILRKKLDFKTPAKIAVATKIIASFVGISVAYAGYGVWALVASGLCSSLLGLIFTWIYVKWYPRERFSKDSFYYLWGFGSKLIASLLIDAVQGNIAPIIIGKYFSSAQLGLFNRANSYAILPASTISGVMQNVTYPVLSKLQDDPDALARNYRRMIRTTNFVVFPLLMLLAVLAKPIIILMITEKWIDCVPLLQILCFCTMFVPISGLNKNYLQVISRTDLLLKLDIPKKIVGVSLILVTLPFGLITFCIGLVIEQLFCITINIGCVGKVSGIGIKAQFSDILPLFTLSAVSGILSWFSTSFFELYSIQIIVGCCTFTAIYIFTAIILKFSEFNDVIYMIKRNK